MTSGIRIVALAWKFGRQSIAESFFGTAVVCLVAVVNSQTGQQADTARSGLKNGGFEESDPAGLPTGWSFPAGQKAAGYTLSIDKTNPIEGKNSVLLDSTNLKQ